MQRLIQLGEWGTGGGVEGDFPRQVSPLFFCLGVFFEKLINKNK